MSSKDILEKVIQKAIEGGWIIDDVRFSGDMTVESVCDWFDDDHGDLSVNNLIWRHDFAKALWGDKPVKLPWYDAIGAAINGEDERTWQYHLQQLVIAEDPIKYLGEHLA